METTLTFLSVMQVASLAHAALANFGSSTLTIAMQLLKSGGVMSRTASADMGKLTSESKPRTSAIELPVGRLVMRMAEKSDGRETLMVVAPSLNRAQAPPSSRVQSSIGSSSYESQLLVCGKRQGETSWCTVLSLKALAISFVLAASCEKPHASPFLQQPLAKKRHGFRDCTDGAG